MNPDDTVSSWAGIAIERSVCPNLIMDHYQHKLDNYRVVDMTTMHKKQFQGLANAICEIERHLQTSRIPRDLHDELMELVTARIALMCAQGNPHFDSFTFHEAARREKNNSLFPANYNRPPTRARSKSPRSPRRWTRAGLPDAPKARRDDGYPQGSSDHMPDDETHN